MNWVQMQRDLTLYKFVDIYLMLQVNKNQMIAERLVQKIKTLGMEKKCYYTLERTKELFQIEDEALEEIWTGICPDCTPDEAFSALSNQLEPILIKAQEKNKLLIQCG